MNRNFIISCESTADLPYERIASRGASVLFYTYTMDGEERADDMGQDPEKRRLFYEDLKNGKMPHTSQISSFRYYEYLKKLSENADVLHITFSSGLTPSYSNAKGAAEELKTEFPDRRITVVDSLCGCIGYGLLVEDVLTMKENGKTLDEIEAWVYENRLRMQHHFFSTELAMFKRSGRVSGPVALVGGMLGVCPIMHLNEEGRIIAYDKALGKKRAIAKTVSIVLSEIDNGVNYDRKIYIGHSNCMPLAEATQAALAEGLHMSEDRFEILDIGSIIASHCGPGTVAVFYYGAPRGAKA